MGSRLEALELAELGAELDAELKELDGTELDELEITDELDELLDELDDGFESEPTMP